MNITRHAAMGWLACALGIIPGVAAAQTSGFSAPPCGAGSPPPMASAQTARRRAAEPPVNDMIAQPDGIPHGAITPSGRPIGWALKPRVWRGNQPQPGWSVLVSTAMVYADSLQPVSPGVRVQVRNIELFVKPKATGQWCLLDRREAPSGGLYREDFGKDQSIPLGARPEASGGISVRLVPGRNFHFWGNKQTIPAGGLQGIYTQFQARLIVDDHGQMADLVSAAYLGSASADYWKSMTAPAGQVGILNEDVAIGRFARITPNWRVFSMNSDATPAMAPKP